MILFYVRAGDFSGPCYHRPLGVQRYWNAKYLGHKQGPEKSGDCGTRCPGPTFWLGICFVENPGTRWSKNWGPDLRLKLHRIYI